MEAPDGAKGGRSSLPKLTFDIAVIGAGAAGLSVAYGTARFGLAVALIERGTMGGECLNTGCIPSKTLLHAARRGQNWEQAQAQIRTAIGKIAPADSVERYSGLGVTVLRGTARFTGPAQLDVDGQAVHAKRIVIAAGSRPRIPAFCANLKFLTNETIWDLPSLPAHLLILGAGPMGCEMAEAFAGLGSQVTLIGEVLPREDAELVAPMIAALVKIGVNIIPQRAVAAQAGPVLTLGNGEEITGSHLLLAAGRAMDIAGLNLPAAGIIAGPDGIKTDVGLRAMGCKNIFAVGDCADPAGIGPQRFTHVAGAHAGIVLRRAVFRLPAQLSAAPPVRVVYTAPELAQIGFTEREAGPGAHALVSHFSENDRAVTEDDTAGLIKLVLDRRGRLIGAGIVGTGAGEMIGLYALAISQKIKFSALAGLVLPYPSRSEAGKRAAGAYFATKLFAPWPRRLVRWLTRLP